jgi:hypothetical protein
VNEINLIINFRVGIDSNAMDVEERYDDELNGGNVGGSTEPRKKN